MKPFCTIYGKGCILGASSLLSKSVILHNFSRHAHHSCKVLVVGGGTGGCTMAAKLSKKFHEPANQVIVVEPSEIHYYQPLFTLIGGGIKPFSSSKRSMKDVLPKNAKWIKDSVMSFDPEKNQIMTSNGDTVEYEIMIVALGLQFYWNQIPGLVEGLKNPDGQVCSIYSPDTVTQVYDKIQSTKSGNAIFTFPNTPVKCPGAPQKIAYLAEAYWRERKLRKDIKVIYNTSLPVIFGVKKYADALWNVCKQRDINVNVQTSLIKINSNTKEAVFKKLDKKDEEVVLKYSFLHVCPPMGPVEVLKKHSSLTNEAGFLIVDPKTLRHQKYLNIYGIGDCTNTPNSKTMAAIASQAKVLYNNILDDLDGKPMRMAYNGYASCPLVTGYGKCILAEFDYNLKPMETFPVDQGKELYSMYWLKKTFFPFLYWNLMLKGYWDGPETYRKMLTIFSRKGD